jgi:hypothetical protein
MANVPHQFVGWNVEYAMKCERKLDDPEIRRQVAAVYGTRTNEQLPNLTCENVDLLTPQAFDVCRRVDALDYH